LKFRVYVQHLTTYDVECGSEEEARALVLELQNSTRSPDPPGCGMVKLHESVSVTV
jgi:hypothetical protein